MQKLIRVGRVALLLGPEKLQRVETCSLSTLFEKLEVRKMN